MKIKRELCGQIVEIELTDTELYQAYRKYCVNSYMFDVKDFIRTYLKNNENIKTAYVREMAELFFDEKNNELTDIYAMARVVIPYLKCIGISCNYTVEDFFDSDAELNCI